MTEQAAKLHYVTRLRQERDQLQREIAQFRLHLLSDKFRGTELVCSNAGGCGRTVLKTISGLGGNRLCPECCSPVSEERKDWISTGDVLRWLDGLEGILR